MSFANPQFHIFLQLLLAAFLGAMIGLEREYQKKEAGLRTFSLVAMGSCFFTVVAAYFSMPQSVSGISIHIDPARVIQAVAIGIGFIGSGLIIQNKAQIEGLTTAAALWATAAMGIGVGLQLYTLSILGAVLIVAILAVFKELEEKTLGKS